MFLQHLKQPSRAQVRCVLSALCRPGVEVQTARLIWIIGRLGPPSSAHGQPICQVVGKGREQLMLGEVWGALAQWLPPGLGRSSASVVADTQPVETTHR